MGAMAIFEEKYGERVRVVKIGDYSMELCGGIHLIHTGEIGYLRILSESSAAAGIRRLEAVTGDRADSLLRQEKNLMLQIQQILNCKGEEISERIQHLLDEKHRIEKEIRQLRLESANQSLAALVENASRQNGVKVVSSKIQISDVDELKQVADMLRAKMGTGVGVLGSVVNDKVSFVCVVTDDLVSGKKLNASEIVKKVAAIVEGSGGGKPHMALAGGKNIGKIDLALAKVPDIISEFVKQ
jgi:alanyl-tRNA synthetase